jgi:hypothetical protein
MTTVTVTPTRYVTIGLAAQLTGYTAKAIEGKIDRGDWLENDVWIKAEDGRRLVDLRGFERWVERRKGEA